MTTPAVRTPVRVARGTYANLNASIADLQEGELCYATDLNKIYVVEGAALIFSSVSKADVGLGNADNTADTAKPVSTAQQTALDLKANLASPTFVTPALGTPASGTLTNCTFPTLNQNTTGNAATATTANAVNTANSYQVAALGIGQAADTGTELDLAGRYAQTSIAVAALDIDCSLGNYFTKTITSSSTFTFSNIPASRSYSFTLCVTHDSGTITWPASVKWPKNTAPTLNTYKKHKFMFVTNDGGSVFYGAALVDFTY